MSLYLNLVDKLNMLVKFVLGLMIATMSVLILTQIFTRFVINYPLHWTEELARYLMIYSVFLGAAVAIRYNRLIAIEAIAQAMSETKRLWLKRFVMLLTIIFSSLVIFYGIDILDAVKNQTSAGLRIPMNIPYFAIPLGAGLMIINAIAVMIDGGKSHYPKEGEETTWQ